MLFPRHPRFLSRLLFLENYFFLPLRFLTRNKTPTTTAIPTAIWPNRIAQAPPSEVKKSITLQTQKLELCCADDVRHASTDTISNRPCASSQRERASTFRPCCFSCLLTNVSASRSRCGSQHGTPNRRHVSNRSVSCTRASRAAIDVETHRHTTRIALDRASTKRLTIGIGACRQATNRSSERSDAGRSLNNFRDLSRS